MVGGVHIGAGREQPAHHFDVILIGRRVKRAPTAIVLRLDAGALLQQPVDRSQIACGSGANEPGVALGRRLPKQNSR